MNSNLLIANARIITPSATYERGWLLTNGDKIALLGRGKPPDFMDVATIDAHGLCAIPGFIDVHAHGGDGCESMDASPESLRQIAQFYAKHGVTAFLATTWTASRERIQAALSVIAAAQGPQPNGATLIGAHLEGPYLNPSRCGAQDTQQIRRAIEEEARAFLDLNVIRLLAVAPEYQENLWLISECARRGITVSAAHTASTYEDIQLAVGLGLTQSTHTFNAMTPLNHRQPGSVGAVLTMPEIYCELIADNIHVHPAVMQILLAAKGIERVILITDAVRGAGLPAGTSYNQDGRIVTLRDGGAYLADETLAGSTLTMDRAFYNFIQATHKSLDTLWPTTSLNAAQALHIAHSKGSLEVGKDADIVLVNKNIEVNMTIAQGKIVYRQNS
ncbi:MAG: N-acetylglucosamine-6-phosphate deacetylase [Anaerolineae bacterium]|nr:N-acetylglucosamine-6-phosphate deacetylase [Anaerolineae bacterium]